MFLKFVKKYWWICILTSIMVILETVVDLLQPDLMADIVDIGVLGSDLKVIITLGIKMIIIVAIGGLTGIAGSVFGNMAGQGVGCDIRKALFEKTMHLSFEQSDRFTTGSLVTRLSDDVTRVQDSVKVAFRGIARYAFMLFGGIYMLYLQSPPFAFVAVCALPFLAFFIIFFIKRSTGRFTEVQKKLDGISSIMQEDVAGARVIKAYGRQEGEAERFEKANKALFSSSYKVQAFLAFLIPCMNIVLNLCVAAIILIGGFEVSTGGTVTPGQVMAAVTYFAIILTASSTLGNLSQTFIRARASWVRIREVLQSESSITDGTGSFEQESADTPMIEFSGVSFAYPGSDTSAVEDISFKLMKGQTLGIIGSTGCGKTTLANLIPRFYDPQKGSIRIEGCDIKELRLSELRERIAYVLQGSELYNRSIRENVSWGSEGASDEEVISACETAQAGEFIEELPEGYDTVITEGGHSVSGGQKQRLAIARAVLKGSPILIMDDATSALDLRTEAALYEALEAKYPDQTRLIIAQRISTIQDADIILVMDNGRAAACAPHDELLESCSIYRQIYDSQLKGGADLG